MGKLWIGLAAAMLLGLPAPASASGPLENAAALEKTISLEGLSGIGLAVARAYNYSPWLYAACCTAAMAVVGVAVAVAADVVLRMLGLQVGKIEHKE